MASDRDESPSFVKMLLTCRATVFSLMTSSVAIARLVLPVATSVRTSRSRRLSPPGPRRPRQASEALEIGPCVQLLEHAARRRELKFGARTVAELAAGDRDQQPDTRRLMRRVEIAPRAMRPTECGERRPWITFPQQDGPGCLSGEGGQIRGVELGGDPGKLIGRRPRAPDILGLEHNLDVGVQKA